MVPSQSQLQTTQHHHHFVLQKVNCNDADRTEVFAKPTLRCNLTEFMSSDSQGLIALRLQIVWTLGEPDDATAEQASRFTQQLTQGALDSQRTEPNRRYLSIEDIDLCAFTNRKANGPSTGDEPGPAPLRGQQQGRIVALRYRSPPHSHEGFRHLQCKFHSEQDALAFVAVIENVCPFIGATHQKAASKVAARNDACPSQPASTPRSGPRGHFEWATPSNAKPAQEPVSIPPATPGGGKTLSSDTIPYPASQAANIAQSQVSLDGAAKEISEDDFAFPSTASPVQRKGPYADAAVGQPAAEPDSQMSVDETDSSIYRLSERMKLNGSYSTTQATAASSSARADRTKSIMATPRAGQPTQAAFARLDSPGATMVPTRNGAFKPMKEEGGRLMAYEQKDIDASMTALYAKAGVLPHYADKIMRSPWFPLVMDALSGARSG